MMRWRACAVLPVVEHSTYGQGYERMRFHAVEPGIGHDRHGLAVVALRGVAAWLHAFAKLPALPAAVGAGISAGPLLTGVEKPAIDILLGMIKGHIGRESA